MAEPAAAPKKNFFKIVMGSFLGLCAGAGTMYFNAIFNTVVRPSKPVANFNVSHAEGLTATFANKATGSSGWWDFGDGSALEPFDPDAQTVNHTYPKPGTYNAKLIVRNFLLDENDRSISVEVAASSSTPNTLPPKLVDLKLEKISETVPATFRMSGEVQNADEVVWAYGDTREHVSAPPGKFERFFQIYKAGQEPVVLTALSRSKITPDVKVFPVTVSNPKEAVFDVRLELNDVSSRSETINRVSTMPVPFKDAQGKSTPGFSRVVAAGYKCTIKSAKIDTSKMKNAALIKNPKAQVSADGRNVTISADWAYGSAEAMEKAAGGNEVFIPVALEEEKVTTFSPGRNAPGFKLSGVADKTWQGQMHLPTPSAGVQRSVSVIIGLTQVDGTHYVLARGQLDASNNWAAPLGDPVKGFNAKATVTNGDITVAVGNFPITPTAAPAPAAAPATTPAPTATTTAAPAATTTATPTKTNPPATAPAATNPAPVNRGPVTPAPIPTPQPPSTAVPLRPIAPPTSTGVPVPLRPGVNPPAPTRK